MKKTFRAAVIAAALAAAALAAATAGAAPGSKVVGHLYVNDNTAGVNTIAGFDRHADGSLTAIPGSPFAAGGAGTGHGIGSQGALQLTRDGKHLLAVDAGSNEISVLRIQRRRPARARARRRHRLGRPHAREHRRPRPARLRRERRRRRRATTPASRSRGTACGRSPARP